jgi:hypothetical protein
LVGNLRQRKKKPEPFGPGVVGSRPEKSKVRIEVAVRRFFWAAT